MKKLLEKLETDFNFDEMDLDDVIECIENEEKDFIVSDTGDDYDDYRFIHNDIIHETIKEHLLNDVYALGCHNDWFISDITNLPMDTIQQAQKNDCFEVLGALMILDIDKVVTEKIKHDSYASCLDIDDDEHFENDFHFFKVS